MQPPANASSRLKILMVSPEVTPVVKVGGLADVVGSLSKVLRARGHDVRVIIPRYAGMKGVDKARADVRPLVVNLGEKQAYGRLWEATLPDSDVPAYLVEHELYFGGRGVYNGPSGDETDNRFRFTFLSRAALDLCHHLNWYPDVFHVHDWATAILPVYLNTTEWATRLGDAASVLTIHNLQHQGWFSHDTIAYAGLPASTFRSDCMECYGEVNLLKGGLYNATKITTVSPKYAMEIQEPAGGCGQHHLLRFRAADLIGILNGIDKDEWDPAKDPLIAQPFSADAPEGKQACKRQLQETFKLDTDTDRPVFGVVSRLYDQKGLDLLATIVPKLLTSMDIQLVVVGSGEPALEQSFQELASRFPGKMGAFIGFDNKVAHQLVAGSDCLLMPSRFEPCGLSQIYAMLYGTLPVVRNTGGLHDTVEPFDAEFDTGTGFRFDDATPQALYDTIGWACATYYDQRELFENARQRAMRADFTWGQSAKLYEDVYTWAIDARALGRPKSPAPTAKPAS